MLLYMTDGSQFQVIKAGATKKYVLKQLCLFDGTEVSEEKQFIAEGDKLILTDKVSLFSEGEQVFRSLENIWIEVV